MTSRFFECPNCGYFHPEGFDGSCDAEETRLDLDMLDEQCPDGWEEIALPVSSAPNLARLERLRPDIDLNGNKLEVGCPVRFFLSACYVSETDIIAGIILTDTSGMCAEGILEAINEIDEEGVPRYRIRVLREHLLSYDSREFNMTGKLVAKPRGAATPAQTGQIIRPRVNGYPTHAVAVPSEHFNGLMISPELTCPMFAVFRGTE